MVSERGPYYDGLVVPIHLEPRNPAMDKKLIITVATTGAFIKREQSPNMPYTPEEVASQAIEAYKAGAAVHHVHVRDKEGFPIMKDPGPIKEAVDMVLDACPDIIFNHSSHVDTTKRGAAGIMPLVETLVKARTPGRRYIDSVVIVPASTRTMHLDEALLTDIVEYLQGYGIKPEFQIFHYLALDNLFRWLIQPGRLGKPYAVNILSGLHGPYYVGPATEPWASMYLMTMLNSLPKDCVVGATIGGRSWLPLTIEAIMLGVDCVRIGMEDTIWMYPHKDEKIHSCAEVVNKVVTIAKELGREIATPAEARQILGLG